MSKAKGWYETKGRYMGTIKAAYKGENEWKISACNFIYESKDEGKAKGIK